MKSLGQILLVMVALLTAVLFAPVADAQTYGAGTVQPSPDSVDAAAQQEQQLLDAINALQNCGALAPATVASSGDSVEVILSKSLADCATNVVIGSNPVLFEGPAPIIDNIVFGVPGDLNGSMAVDLVVDLKTGNVFTQTLVITAGDEVLGIQQVAGQELAFTGGSVSVPLAAGSAMIVLGTAAMFVAKRRDAQ